MATRRHEVVVVGGGVVGAAVALALVRKGFDVALLEKGAAPPPFDAQHYDPRVYALSPGSARFLDGLGAWSRVEGRRASPYELMQVWDHAPDQALRFDAAEFGVRELGFIVEDGLLRDVLWGALQASAAVRTSAAVTALAPAAGGWRLALASGDAVEAALVIAAEGADSPLRAWAGIEPLGWSYPQRSVVCHVTTAQPHRRAAYQRFLPDGPLAFLPLADGRSSIVWSTASNAAAELLTLDDAAFCERLAHAAQDILGAIERVTPRRGVSLRLLHAENYVKPGLVLVGDSAHVIHPLAGQGLNLGLADAQALVDVVTQARAQRRPIGALRVLQRYEWRRKAANLEAMALTDVLYRLFDMRAPAVDALRTLGLSLFARTGPLKRRLARRAMGIDA